MGAFMVFSPNSETNKHLTHQPGMGLGKMYIGSGHPKQLLKRLIRLTLLALPNLSGQQAKTLFDNALIQPESGHCANPHDDMAGASAALIDFPSLTLSPLFSLVSRKGYMKNIVDSKNILW